MEVAARKNNQLEVAVAVWHSHNIKWKQLLKNNQPEVAVAVVAWRQR